MIQRRAFNGWKKLVVIEKYRKEHQNHQNEIRNESLANRRAVEFYHKTLREKFFNCWKKYIKNELLKKKINNDKNNVKNRMQHFLEAAKDDRSLVDDTTFDDNGNSTSRTVNSTISNIQKRPASRINLQKKIAKNKALNNDQFELEKFKANQPAVDYDKKVKNMLQPWLKNQTAEIFDSRFKAQEKILNEQSKMIKEQKRMIEELKFQQNQLAFKEQISLLEEIKARQIELEKLQKAEYAQEKKLLKIKSQTNKIEIQHDNNSQRETDDENSNKHHPDESKIESTRSVKQIFNPIAVKMDERARQREKLKKEREEKRKQSERQKLELIKAQEEERIKIEEEEKQKKMEELKEKKKLQKIQEEKKNLELLKDKELNQKADEFYKKHLLRFYGLNGFKKLIELRDRKMALANGHYGKKIMKLVFSNWNILIRGELIVKQKKADQFYHKILLKNAFFNGLKQFKQSLLIGNAKAIRFYNYSIKLKLFQNWQIYANSEREKSQCYEIMIAEHNSLRIRKKYFKMFKEYPEEIKKYRARQKRLDQLRNKVKEMIPDYQVSDQ
ncbi:coiled-coil domain-containing protein [Brachionus plicatilis]|uniref:Coiled-coil domain-containing protein n=1 Tax=Brachionus plicatilis TaxID=10195 RepID=A0A3M7QB89_BRAPC|nr:coiled-coil domain-containing protein [Brachionus plicatilis]